MRLALSLSVSSLVGVWWITTTPVFTVLTLCSLVDRQSPIAHHDRHGGLLRTNKGKALQYRYDDVEEAVQDGGGRVLYAGAVETVFVGRHAWWEKGEGSEHWGDDEQWHIVIVSEYTSLEAYRANRKSGLLPALLREVEYREEVISRPETPYGRARVWLSRSIFGPREEDCEEGQGAAGKREEGHSHADHTHTHHPLQDRLLEWRERGAAVAAKDSSVEILELVRYNRSLTGPDASRHYWACHMARLAKTTNRPDHQGVEAPGAAPPVWIDRMAKVYPTLPHYGGLWHAWGLVGYVDHGATALVEQTYREHVGRGDLHSRVLLASRRLLRRSGAEKRIVKPAKREEAEFPYYMDTNTEHMYKTLHNVKEHSEISERKSEL